jgi:hypothetical protein
MKGIWFFDDWMLERRDCLERVWGKPTFVKEIFTEFNPPGWDGYGGYPTAFYDERLGRYVMYLNAYPGRKSQNRTPGISAGEFQFRVQSDDPYNWPNPSYEPSATLAWQGFKEVVIDQDGNPIWCHAVHSLAGTPLAQRGYASAVLDVANHLTWGGFSDDGVQFTVDRKRPWFDPGSDIAGDILWNREAGLYEIFVRPVYADRRVAISTTADFEQFSRPTTILQPDALDRVGLELYDMPPRSYEDFYIGLLNTMSTDRFEEVSLSRDWPQIKYFGRMETELTYSYNGLYWYRTVREPFIGVRDYGLQGGGSAYGKEMLRTKDNRLLFFVVGDKGGHAARIDQEIEWPYTSGYRSPMLYEMRLDGFCSLKTWGNQGVLRTKVVIPRAGEVSLNVRTMTHTAIKVQMLDGMTAQPIPGYTWDEALPISGDYLFAKPRWQERDDISDLVDRPVRFEIAMREAELFAIRSECDAYYACEPLPTLW